MRISLFIVARLTPSLGDSASEVEDGSKKVRAVVLQGRVMSSFGFHHQRPSIHVCGTRESRGCPMHRGATVSEYNLPPNGLFPQRRQQLTGSGLMSYRDPGRTKYVTRGVAARHLAPET